MPITMSVNISQS